MRTLLQHPRFPTHLPQHNKPLQQNNLAKPADLQRAVAALAETNIQETVMLSMAMDQMETKLITIRLAAANLATPAMAILQPDREQMVFIPMAGNPDVLVNLGT